ncbi:hypothetical protein ACHQM5_008491 [Ranunculus cassubicifolius]
MAAIASTICSSHISSVRPQSINRSSAAKPSLLSRRQSLFIVTAPMSLAVMELTAKAEDIGLFGLRKKLKKVEEEAVELVKEGVQGIENVEKEAEREIEQEKAALSSGGGEGALAQAGLVLGVETVGVLVATSVVNGILASE